MEEFHIDRTYWDDWIWPIEEFHIDRTYWDFWIWPIEEFHIDRTYWDDWIWPIEEFHIDRSYWDVRIKPMYETLIRMINLFWMDLISRGISYWSNLLGLLICFMEVFLIDWTYWFDWIEPMYETLIRMINLIWMYLVNGGISY